MEEYPGPNTARSSDQATHQAGEKALRHLQIDTE